MPDLDWNKLTVIGLLGFMVTAFMRGWVISAPVYRLLASHLDDLEKDRQSLLDSLQKMAERLAR